MSPTRQIRIGEIVIELNVPSGLAPSVVRAIAGRTERDAEVDELPLPRSSMALNLSVRAVRLYRQLRPSTIANRCVFDPSCSRYCEASLRKHGVALGTWIAIKRLCRCRPGAGGVDAP